MFPICCLWWSYSLQNNPLEGRPPSATSKGSPCTRCFHLLPGQRTKEDRKVRCCASRDFHRHQLPRYSATHADSFRERKIGRNILLGHSLFCHSFLHSTGTYFQFVSTICISRNENQRTKLERDRGNTGLFFFFLLFTIFFTAGKE